MKKSLLALAVLGGFAGVASAQSSVTLFGLVDLSINDQSSNGKRIISEDSNQLSSNRLGFKGTEDLGGGNSAGFWLEAGMSNQNGQSGGLQFNRRSTVSLAGPWGEVRLGRDYTPSFWTTATMEVFGANGIGEFDNLALSALGSGVSDVRVNNSVAYFLPGNIGGLYGRVTVAAGQGTITNKYTGGQLGWAGSGFEIVGAYGVHKTATSNDYKMYNLAASYDFGAAKIYLLGNESKYGNAALKTEGISAGIPFGVSAINLSYTHASYSGSTTFVGSANQIGAQYTYSLSKRTTLYASAARISNSGGAGFQFGDLPASVSVVNQSVTGYNAGIRHSF